MASGAFGDKLGMPIQVGAGFQPIGLRIAVTGVQPGGFRRYVPAMDPLNSTALGTGPCRVLGVRTFGDDLLAAISPLGLALAAGSGLVVDLDPDGPRYPSERTVAEIVAEGPTLSELSPSRAGVATIGNGGAEHLAALQIIATLAGAWPAIIMRVGSEPVPYPVIPVRPLWPGFMTPRGERPSVWQSVGSPVEPPGDGPVLPPPGRATVSALLAGRRPVRSRWVMAWRQVWELPWR